MALQNQNQVDVALDFMGEGEIDLGIADRMLAMLEKEYQEVHASGNLSMGTGGCQGQGEGEGEEEGDEWKEGYVNFSNQVGNGLQSSDESQSEDEENQNQKQNNDEGNLCTNNQGNAGNPESQQFIEIGPVPNQIFTVPPPSFQNQTDLQKIKSTALSFDIATPDWAKDPVLLEQRIRDLFNKK